MSTDEESQSSLVLQFCTLEYIFSLAFFYDFAVFDECWDLTQTDQKCEALSGSTDKSWDNARQLECVRYLQQYF